MDFLMGKIRNNTRAMWLESVGKMEFNVLYKELDMKLDDKSYISDDHDRNFMHSVIRTRSGQLRLNICPCREEHRLLCSMCNMSTLESVVHFLGMCPVLGEIWKKWFISSTCSRDVTICKLNGENWYSLVGFLLEATAYRRWLIKQFNY